MMAKLAALYLVFTAVGMVAALVLSWAAQVAGLVSAALTLQHAAVAVALSWPVAALAALTFWFVRGVAHGVSRQSGAGTASPGAERSYDRESD